MVGLHGSFRVAAVAAAAAAGVGVAACNPLHPGAAATVAGVAISVSDVHQAAVKSLVQAQLTEDTPVAERDALTNLIRDQVVRDAGKSKGITVTEADIQDLLSQARAQSGSDAATAAQNGVQLSDLHELVYEAVLYERLGAIIDPGQTDGTVQGVAVDAFLEKYSGTIGISVSPRYGFWSAKNYSVLAADAFASPAPGEAASPSAAAIDSEAPASAPASAGG